MSRPTDGRPARRRRDRVHDVEVASIVAGPDGACASGGSEVLDVVLVHGLGVSDRYLVSALRAFARDHRVFAPDLPGVGRSSTPERDLSMTDLADGLHDWMDVVGCVPPRGAGTSPTWTRSTSAP